MCWDKIVLKVFKEQSYLKEHLVVFYRPTCNGYQLPVKIVRMLFRKDLNDLVLNFNALTSSASSQNFNYPTSHKKAFHDR